MTLAIINQDEQQPLKKMVAQIAPQINLIGQIKQAKDINSPRISHNNLGVMAFIKEKSYLKGNGDLVLPKSFNIHNESDLVDFLCQHNQDPKQTLLIWVHETVSKNRLKLIGSKHPEPNMSVIGVIYASHKQIEKYCKSCGFEGLAKASKQLNNEIYYLENFMNGDVYHWELVLNDSTAKHGGMIASRIDYFRFDRCLSDMKTLFDTHFKRQKSIKY